MTAKQITIRETKVEINYFQQGQGDTTLLFLHGWCIDGTYWKNQVDYFSKAYNVFAIDLPGFGKSKAARTNWTIEEYANDVTAFIDTMNLKKRCNHWAFNGRRNYFTNSINQQSKNNRRCRH